jgi:hypothetical protein
MEVMIITMKLATVKMVIMEGHVKRVALMTVIITVIFAIVTAHAYAIMDGMEILVHLLD